MVAYRLDPFWRVVGVHWDVGQQWVIIDAGTDFVGPGDYDGETDGVRASSGFFNLNGRVLHSGPFTDEATATAAWDAYKATFPTYAIAFLRWTKSTEFPTPPSDYADWGTLETAGGWLGYGLDIGKQSDGISPDPNCPPFQYQVGGAGAQWATQAHALNWLAWQNSLGPMHSSATEYYEDPVTHVKTQNTCIPGTP